MLHVTRHTHLNVRLFRLPPAAANDVLTSETLSTWCMVAQLFTSSTVTLLPLHQSTTPVMGKAASSWHSTNVLNLNFGARAAGLIDAARLLHAPCWRPQRC